MIETRLRAIWFAFIVLASALIAVVGGVLSFLGGARAANAVLTAGGAFVAATTLGMLMLAFLTNSKVS